MAESEELVGTVSHYRVLTKLGGGGMGVVYKAEDTLLERFTALKFLPPEFANDKQMRERFMREARAASALNHPNICTIYEVGEADDRIFIAMEFLDGLTLREMVQAGPIEMAQLFDIAGQVLDGLEAAHAEGIIHRDVKLANIFVTKSGRVKILDFGLAKKAVAKRAPVPSGEPDGRGVPEEQLTSGLAALGTAAYMSPEQALGRPLDARTDLFSFGIVLYEMATGRAPFRGDTTGVLLLSIVQESPEPPRQINPGVPEGLQRIIDQCLQKSRELRYQTAAEIHEDLRKLQKGFGAREGGAATAAETIGVTNPKLPSDVTPGVEEQEKPRIAKPEKEPAQRPVWRSWKVRTGIIGLATGLVLAGGLYVHSQRAQALRPRDTVVLADFTNTTGEAVFDGSLKQAARFDLEQSPFLNVLADRHVIAVLGLMNRPEGQRLTQEVAREVCLRTNSKALIAPSVTKVGNGYMVSVKALACSTGKEIASSQAEATGKAQVLRALERADGELRRKLGESLPSLEKFNRPLEESTTSSLEALQEYTEGLKAFQVNSLAEAVPHLQRAVKLDPNFAQAHASLGAVYYSAGETLSASESFRTAYELRNRVSERERFSITANYFRRVTGQTDQAIETCKQWIRLYPDDYAAYLTLGGSYLYTGELEKAAQANRDAIDLAPERISAYINAMVAYKDQDRYDEAKATFNAARARNLDNDVLRINRYVIAFLEGDTAGMQEQIEWAAGKAGSEDRLLEDWADTEAYYGRYGKARELSNKAISAARRDGVSERALEHQAHAVLREAEIGNRLNATQWATLPSPSSTGEFVKVILALAFAKAGESNRAEKLADELERGRELHVIMQQCYLPMLRAQIELNRNNPDKAIEILQPTLAFDYAAVVLDGMQLTYVRGLAYLRAGKGQEAATEFQKLIGHPGLVEMWVTGSLARLQLARAEELKGDHESARRHYQDFFALWKDADANLAVLQQAKAEYAKLP